jgi:hypothetical protein
MSRWPRYLHEAVRVLGSKIEAARVIDQIRNDFDPDADNIPRKRAPLKPPPSQRDLELMAKYGIKLDRGQYHYKEYRYDKLGDNPIISCQENS